MSMSTLALSVSVRLYSWLILAYPAPFRREYGEPMIQVFRDLCRDAVREQGCKGLLGVWLRVLPELVTTAIEQHLLAVRKPRLKLTMTRLLPAIPPGLYHFWWRWRVFRRGGR